MHHSRLGMELKVFETKLGDRSRVFISQHLPGQTEYPVLGGKSTGLPLSRETPGPAVNVDGESGRIVSLTGRVYLSILEKKNLLTDKCPLHVWQISPFSVDVVFESQPPRIFTLHFPIPVDKSSATIGIARTSGCVEIVTPIANPLTVDLLYHAMFPTLVADDKSYPPVALKIIHVHLDSLPMIDLSEDRKGTNGEREIAWLNTLCSFQFSSKERKIRKTSAKTKEGLSQSVRVYFKDTLLTLFMLASGLQGGQAGVFTFDSPDKVTHVLLFARFIRLDGPAGSAILEASVFPVDTTRWEEF
ncbi:MYND finger family protein [Zalerion maritima]|uniref:MYND finger family protein n=1 Tax=Zalerion maritima TaxID=339359 RepID=A0AAD5RSG0_9PEZI|nr:MYND finger family protein [Zalerion maritima]